ncbi:MAG: hypothetical protein ABIH03_02150 [Pseudomonadota bacterium]
MNSIDEVPDGQIELSGESIVTPSVISVQIRQIEALNNATARALHLAIQRDTEEALASGQLVPGIFKVLQTVASVVGRVVVK